MNNKILKTTILFSTLLISCSNNKESSNTDNANNSNNEAKTTSNITSNTTYESNNNDESALEISSDTYEISNVIINKNSGEATSANDANFKGVNSALRVYDSGVLTINNSTINSKAKNATGVFAYNGGKIYINDTKVEVSGSGSGGVEVAGGGYLYGKNLNVTSASKAAIRSDRGGGILEIDGGTYVCNGTSGAPSIYSTADIKVKNATCISNNSRAVIIEGKNTVVLENVDLSGNDTGSTKTNTKQGNILLYQSASGDAKVGTSEFSSTSGKIKANNGVMFYCTNTTSIVNLNNTELTLSSDNTLIECSSQSRWGKEGSNGGKMTFNASNQSLEGSINVDSISSLNLNLTNSNYVGSIQNTGTLNLKLNNSTWKLTGDSYISSFEGDKSNIDLNGFKLYVNNELLS